MSSRQKTPRKPKTAIDAAKEATEQTQQSSSSNTIVNVGRAAAILLIAGFASPVSQLNLTPVFGSIPASLHHQRTMTITAAAALIGRKGLKRYVSADLAQYIAVVAYWVPVIQFFLFSYSEKLTIEYGPLIIESLTYFPLLFLSMYAAADLIETVDFSQFGAPPAANDIATPIAAYFTVSSLAKIANAILPDYIGTSIYFARIGLQMLLASASAFVSPSRVIFLAFPAILHTLWANPHHPSDHGFQLANSTLYANQNYTLLARQESITGYVSVMESTSDNAFRLLRCDHSLLGGEWLVTPQAYAKGQRQRESIFAVFVLLEAVRLVDPAPETEVVPDSKKSALNIGLGIGTAPNAMIAHGINTTIVELDPVVHHYATKYFGLSPRHTAVIDDAVSYVAHKSVSAPENFDYIMHDVFTGGAEPVYLFTTEFMTGLYDLLKPDGSVAINYAGDLTLGSTKLVLNTILSIFPSCRLFRDQPPPESQKPGDSDFINMVIFCVKTKRAITFREPEEKDYLGSIARHNFLWPKDKMEVKYEYVEGAGVMGKKDVGELEKFHEEGAVSHWRIMRTVLPGGVWEMW